MSTQLTKREIELLKILSEKKGFVETQKLCDLLQIKSRTLRECIRIFRDNHEKEYGVEIDSRPGFGYRLIIKDKDMYYALLKSLMEKEVNDQYLMPVDQADRVNYIIRSLLSTNDYIVADDLSEKIYVSRSTFAEDLRKVKEQLAVFDLQINSVPGKGIRIAGDEKKIRDAIAEFYFESGSFDAKQLEMRISYYFSQEKYQTIRNAAYETLRKHEFHMADANFRNLIIHILVAVKRITDGTYIQESDLIEFHHLKDT